MTSDQELGMQKRAAFSPSDLKQIKDAVRELRASSPRSVLAEVVDEKIRTIENDRPTFQLEFDCSEGRILS